MSNGGHRHRSGYRRGGGHGHGHGYSGTEGYVPGAVEGERYSQDYMPAQGSSTYNHGYAYEMYKQPEPYDTGTPQTLGYGGYDGYPSYSTYGNDSTYLNFGNGSGHSGYSSYSNYSNYGNRNEVYADSSSYSYHPTHQESRQRYPTFRNDSYASYGRHSDYAARSYSNFSSHRAYSSYSSSQQPQPNLQPQGQEPRIQHRSSPVYDDYTPDTGSTSYSSQPSKFPSQQYRTPMSPRPEPYLPTPSFSLRARSSSPSKEKRMEPTEEYLAISSQPSHTLAEESTTTQDTDMVAKARKLIVLDLNGTLLLRGQHRRAAYDYVSPTRGWAPTGPPFQARTVYPRPYLSTFIEYILHDETKKWLDAMVWSSAQPGNVDDMVGRSFAGRREELRAVWARDTLGLSSEDYHKKSITLKNLEKPWAELPFTLPVPDAETSTLSMRPSPTSLHVSAAASPPIQEHISGTPSTSRISSPAPLPPSSQTIAAPSSPPPEQSHPENQESTPKQKEHHHSPLSTLLIDDSPVKASLQPWNHLCIREYVAETRKGDLDVLLEEEGERGGEGEGQQNLGEGGEPIVAGSKKRTRDGKKERHRVRDARLRREEKEKESERPDIIEETGDDGADSSMAATMTPGGKDEPLAASTAPLPQVIHDTTTEGSTVATTTTHDDGADSATTSNTKITGDKEYDQTLLAVIGILDRIRYESNVAGWMRAGGLMRVGHDGVDINIEVEDSGRGLATGDAKPTEEGSTTAAREEGQLIEVKSDTEKGKGKTKLIHTPPTRSRDASPLLLSSDSKKRRRVGEKGDSRVGVVMDTNADGAQEERKEKEKEAEREAQAMTGVPLESSPPTPDMFAKSATGAIRIGEDIFHQPSSQRAVDVPPGGDQPKQEAEPEKPKLWFEHPDILAHWAERGKKALVDLGIAVVVGVRR